VTVIVSGRVSVADPRLAYRLYLESKERIVSLMREQDDAAWNAAVPTCPGWSVRDVVAHLTAVADDWAHGRLSAAPSDEQTAAQIARFADNDVPEILAAWTDAAARLEQTTTNSDRHPPVGDITCHEHDIRGAIGRPGARDSEVVRYCADLLLTQLRPPIPLRVTVEDAEFRIGPDDGAELALTTTRFEALRWRTGRRSRAQLAAMEWSADPTPVLDHLAMFGPADTDVIE
jgi:uncharacterized protein (TIGR03083 family)